MESEEWGTGCNSKQSKEIYNIEVGLRVYCNCPSVCPVLSGLTNQIINYARL